jgi:energy-coupling factor transporter ATP-binding protein EcfA2
VFDDPFVTLDDTRAARALGLLKSVASDFQVIYLTTSDRYDEAADAVVVLDGPTTVDSGAPPADDIATTGAPSIDGAAPTSATPAGVASAASPRSGRRA